MCDIAAERWRNGKRVLIACEDEAAGDSSRRGVVVAAAGGFVPHNLAGEGPRRRAGGDCLAAETQAAPAGTF
ncbi:DNA polymerase III subunit chi [Klebsiella variicola subsp. variicola]|nr:DNA polymerase III subunit chi [Klebsiella variicola subsp. variicola]